jgi:hypothetical protein
VPREHIIPVFNDPVFDDPVFNDPVFDDASAKG